MSDFPRTAVPLLEDLPASYHKGGRPIYISKHYRGVAWSYSLLAWVVYLDAGWKYDFVGKFADEVDAANAYDDALHQRYGSRVRDLNFPDKVSEAAAVTTTLKSKYRGVMWSYTRGTWEARIFVNVRGALSLGFFTDEREAAETYDRAAYYYYSCGAKTNFPLRNYLSCPTLLAV